ncbi:MAG: hypothetical protein ACSHYF_08825 [Verrucomicrobiaceae bacterium]
MNASRKRQILCLIPLIVGVALSFALPKINALVELEHQLFWFPKKQSPENTLADRSPLADFRIRVYDVSPTTTEAPRVLTIAEPPSVTDWLFSLNALRTHGAGNLTLSPLLSWTEADELELRALEHEITSFPRATLGLDLRLQSSPEEFPLFLEPSTLKTILGDPSAIPAINALSTPPSVTQGTFGFRLLENAQPELTPAEIRLPLLARWGDKILPSIELSGAASLTGHSSADIAVVLGKHIRIGKNGPVIPIDATGRTTLPTAIPGETEPLSTLIDPDKQASPQNVVITSPENSPHLRQLPTSLTHLTSRLPRDPTLFQRPPSWFEIPLLIFLALLLQARKPLALLLAPLPPILASTSQLWLVLTPALALLLTFLFLKLFLKKSPQPKEKPSPPAPQSAKKQAPPAPNSTPPKKSPAKKTPKKKSPRRKGKKRKKKR